jgi:hypothetical protein
MLPTADAGWVGRELQCRFALPYWQFALTVSTLRRSTVAGVESLCAAGCKPCAWQCSKTYCHLC